MDLWKKNIELGWVHDPDRMFDRFNQIVQAMIILLICVV